jgi:hypothetical protein
LMQLGKTGATKSVDDRCRVDGAREASQPAQR